MPGAVGADAKVAIPSPTAEGISRTSIWLAMRVDPIDHSDNLQKKFQIKSVVALRLRRPWCSGVLER
jgi:hypothetical protein